MQIKASRIEIFYTCAALAAAVFFFLPPKAILSAELNNQQAEIGTLQFRTVKGSASLIFNGTTLSCNGGAIFASNKCPGLLPYGNEPIYNCTAFFASTPSRLNTELKVLVALNCPGKTLPQLSEGGLQAYRERDRQLHCKFFVPISVGAILLFAFIHLYVKGEFKL